MSRFRYVPLTAFGLLFAFGAVACTQDYDQFKPCDPGEHPEGNTCVPDGSTGGSAGSAGSTTAGAGGSGASAGAGGSTMGGSAGSGGTTMTGTGGSGACDAGSKDCDGSCVPLDDPNTHCGDVGNCSPCIDLQYHIVGACNANGTCSSGSCVSGWGECDNDPANGCEMDLTSNLANCGSCNNACQASQACSQGACVPLCGTEPVPSSGYAACWVLDNNTLANNTFGTMTVSIGSPALSGPSDPVDCVSPVAASGNNGNDSSVLCPLTGLAAGQSAYMALKSYGNGDLVAANPPLPFAAFKCDNGLTANAKCTAPVRIYKDGVLIATYVPPAISPFSHDGIGVDAPIELVYTP